MAQLIIKNIGPIKDINITLNKVNVIIGPQSSGKSTISMLLLMGRKESFIGTIF